MATTMTPMLTTSIPRAPSALSGADPVIAGRCYVGERCRAGCQVTVIDGAEAYPLRTRVSDPLWSFSWGRSGASARELAWSMLYDSAQDAALAADWCWDFTAEVVARLPWEAFRLESRDVLAWLADELHPPA
jgi:hypothetical protein